MKITSTTPFEPVVLTLILETPEEVRLLGEVASYRLAIPTMMKLKGEEFITVSMMLNKIFEEIVDLND